MFGCMDIEVFVMNGGFDKSDEHELDDVLVFGITEAAGFGETDGFGGAV